MSLILLGEIEEVENKRSLAGHHWKEAASIARRLNDRQLRFKAEFGLFRKALLDGDDAVARAIGRRLRKLSAWIPSNTQELQAFYRMTEEKR